MKIKTDLRRAGFNPLTREPQESAPPAVAMLVARGAARHRRIVLAIAGLLLAGSTAAEDIDLFLNPPSGTTDQPNVLFMLDNSANWNSTLYKVGNTSISKKNIIHQALSQAVQSPLLTDQVKVGYMTFSTGDGGKVMSAVTPLTASHQATLSSAIFGARVWQGGSSYALGERVVPSEPNGYYYEIVQSGTADGSEPGWPTRKNDVVYDNGVGYKAVNTLDNNVEKIPAYNNAPYALMMNEAYLYYEGEFPREGTADGDHDSAAIAADGRYLSPAAGTCAKNFMILIGSGSPDSNENNTAEAILSSLGGKLKSDPIPLSPDNYESNWSDEFARYMAGVDVVDVKDDKQNLITYVIDVVDESTVSSNPERAARSFLKSIAKQGQGRYFAVKTVAELSAAILEILDEIQAVNSVFASTTLPVSVNVRGTNLNQVYMGVFRPDANALPRWVGNLKLYQLKVESGTNSLYLADRNGSAAESPTTGFVVSNAVSYWTRDSSFWGFYPGYAPSDLPDGEVVEKGAAAQHLREAAARNLFTCTGTCGGGSLLSATPFAASNSSITQAALGAGNATEREAIIDWVRGVDNSYDENSDGLYTDWRASIHGDVLHSRPAVINYNRNSPSDDNDIIAFYGSNDGIFHAVYGGKDGELNDGEELWGFIPEEFFGRLKALYDNSPAITDPAGGKPYFVDGNIGVYQDDGGDGVIDHTAGDKVYLYLSMRRGGRFIYALDVSNPLDPKLLWKRSSASSGWGELGQTWSEPTVARVNIGGNARTVLVFGAGYDPVADDAVPQGSATAGRGILVVDALTGNVIWQAGPSPSGGTYRLAIPEMSHPIPSNVTVINRDRDTDGYADRLYVGDTGGELWRADITDPDPGNWTVRKIASIGGGRKFLYAPDVVYADGYDAILIGSGDREHPLGTSVTNRFYMFKDTGSLTPITEAELYDATANLIQVGSDAEQQTAEIALGAARGWYITMGAGEKVVTSSVTLSGSTFFNTNQPSAPSSTSCAAGLGTARNYVVSYLDGSATTELNGIEGLTTDDRAGNVVGGGFPPSPVPVIVEIDGKKYQAVVSGTKVLTPPNVQLERRNRVYWYNALD